MQNIYHVCGVQIRATDVVPIEVIGANNGLYLSLFWQGAEIGRINPAPNNGVHSRLATVVQEVKTCEPCSFYQGARRQPSGV